MILQGIIPPWSILGWRVNPYILKLVEEFEEIHAQYGGKSNNPAMGILRLRDGDQLFPYYLLQIDGGTIKIECKTKPISMSNLSLCEEEITEIKNSGFLVVKKFEKTGKVAK